jgi:hypothetical protein
VREIRTLRAMWRALETGPYIRFTRQRSTLPGRAPPRSIESISSELFRLILLPETPRVRPYASFLSSFPG